MPEQLIPVETPTVIMYLWTWFIELSNSRDYGEAGPKPITYTEIMAWSQLTKAEPTAWEIEILKQIDRAYLTEAGKK